MLPEPPTTTEWWAAAAAAALVVVLGALHLVGGGRRLGARPLARLGGWLCGCIAVGLLLVFGTLLGAALRASLVSAADVEAQTDLPSGPFAAHLFDPDLGITERVGWISGAYLLPLAGVFAVVALALVDRERSRGMRVAALVASLAVALGAAYVALGTTSPFDTDPGPLAGRVAAAFLAVSLAAALAVGLDLTRGGWTVSAPPAPPAGARARPPAPPLPPPSRDW